MSLVDAETGEIVADITAEDARALTDRIKVGVEAVWHLIAEAYQRRAWAALGHASWDDYCTREFGTSRLRLPREERQDVVASLRESGLSLRAIAAATGLNRETVTKELGQVAGNQPPARPADVDPNFKKAMKVTGTDGKSYPSTRERIERAAKNNPADDRIARARQMADENYSSRQIADALGISDFADFKRRHGIEVPADAVIPAKSRRHDSNRIVEETVHALDGLTSGLALVDLAALDTFQIDGWLVSLTTSLRSLNRFAKQLKETSQ